MADSLLPYFNQELTAIRQLAAEFARTHPKIAGRLRLSPDTVDDPHVARLLDGVAFLSARVHARLDDEFPELTDTLLDILYPHYLAPFPSCAIAEFVPRPETTTPIEIAAGFELETEAVRGQSCRYRTAAPMTLWPVRIESAHLSSQPFAAPLNPRAAGAVAVLRLVVTTLNADMPFSTLGMDRLRLFFRGEGPSALSLYELLAGHTLGVALATSPQDGAPVCLGPDAIQQVGYAAEEALVPWSGRGFAGFRLLSEYFAFPQKFMFLDLCGLGARTMVLDGSRLEIFLYLNHSSAELERTVDADMIALGCAPVVNLFHQRCEPMPLDHTTTDYRVLPDARRAKVTEVWEVTNVTELRQDGTSRPFQPFYRMADPHAPHTEDTPSYRIARREAGEGLGGTDSFVNIFDPAFDPTRPSDSVLSVQALCFNRDLPTELPFGGGHPLFRQLQPHGSIQDVQCIVPPTPTLRPERRSRGAWRLISHLSLGHFSITGEGEGAASLREVLRLYDLVDTAETRAAIEAIVGVHATPGVARVQGAKLGAFCRGLDVELELDGRAFHSGRLYLLTAVLARFMALHANINSFVRTTLRLRGKTEPEARFPPMAGARALL
ncbi:type VI secretion system baseplate subunit TssF [Acetobacter okinawensis]|uniref:type VI secretion system baseplate subunit TssF n=1 Tax=Acetobacter okinawensis TaxID=1076594 RepID=UPI001BA6F473|nr:type VI secretion system baseplate subunit TssF [Acetobacter okinawensis]MBS0964510.1 type VI secretion system baseplate subunit TssF [Acetobacter okinawensis]